MPRFRVFLRGGVAVFVALALEAQASTLTPLTNPTPSIQPTFYVCPTNPGAWTWNVGSSFATVSSAVDGLSKNWISMPTSRLTLTVPSASFDATRLVFSESAPIPTLLNPGQPSASSPPPNPPMGSSPPPYNPLTCTYMLSGAGIQTGSLVLSLSPPDNQTCSPSSIGSSGASACVPTATTSMTPVTAPAATSNISSAGKSSASAASAASVATPTLSSLQAASIFESSAAPRPSSPPHSSGSTAAVSRAASPRKSSVVAPKKLSKKKPSVPSARH